MNTALFVMRTAEWINILIFSFFITLACLRPLEQQRRTKAVSIGAAGIGLILIVKSSLVLFSPIAVSVLRDWLPAALLLMPYWQAGQFLTRPREQLQIKLESLDLRWLGPLLRGPQNQRVRAWLAAYFELAYALCYPLIPFSLGALYVLHLRLYADEFWTVVLPPTYFCHAMVPFLQTAAPRVLEGEAGLLTDAPWLRALNLWILRGGSIQANVFPSAHVAASVAASLELLRLDLWVGLLFLLVSVSIAVGAVLRRYHYAADSLAGAALALTSFLLVHYALR